MPITPHIEAEAKRTIDEIQDYYKRFSDDINDSDEMEHRIARIERLKEACNGLTEKDKLQKTAENLFEVGTAYERGTDMIKKIISRNQKNVESKLAEIRKENNENYNHIQDSIKELSENIDKQFEEEREYNEKHFETKIQLITKDNNANSSTGFKGMVLKFFDSHFGGCLFGILLIIVLLFISGHTDLINQILSKF